MTKYIFAVMVGIFSVHSYAECVMRSTSSAFNRVDSSQVRDLIPWVTKTGSQKKCMVRYRVPIDNVWQTAEGEAVGDLDADETALCVSAVKTGLTKFIVNEKMSKVDSTSDMVCSDMPAVKVRNGVNVGERISESEVQIHPQYPNQFKYKNTMCKWFIDTYPVKRDIVQYQGIICKDSPSSWIVVDKF